MAAFEQFLNDKYLSALHSPLLSLMPTSASADRDKFELSSMSDAPTLLDFVTNTPAPVTKVLVEFHPSISALKRLVFAGSWKGPSEESFLLLFTWWAVCLYGDLFIRFAILPLIILAPLLLPFLPKRFKYKPIPSTEAALASSLSALDAIYSLRPNFTILVDWQPNLAPRERLRLLGLVLVPYTALTYWIPVRVLVAVAGSAVLTYRAPWAVTTRGILTRSAYVRAAWRYALGWLSGNTSLPIPFRKATVVEDISTASKKGNKRQHEFMFTVLENQRWWVGIDWSAALLPSERPSWCAPISSGSLTPQSPNGSATAYHPLPPPASFPLPPSTSVVLPSPDGKGFIKRTAKWKWEDNSEWEVFVHKEGEKEVRTLRVPLKAPVAEDVEKGASLAKAAGKLNVVPSPSASSFEHDSSGGASKPSAIHPENEFTDQDGWVYGDNKWENAAAKAGMGKFTRFRRWHRVALLEEEEELVDEVDVKPSFTQIAAPKLPGEKVVDNVAEGGSHSRAASTKGDSSGSPERSRGRTIESVSLSNAGGDSKLQQRLKAALKGGT